MTALLRRTLLVASLTAVLFALPLLPLQAHAQAVSDDVTEVETPSWMRGINDQVVLLLESDDRAMRDHALRLIIELKARHGAGLDLARAVPTVVELYQDSRTYENDRLLALAALSSMDSRYGYRTLLTWYAEDWEPSDRVRKTLHHVLVDYQMRHGIRS